MAPFASGDSVVRYVLPVCWMASCFYIMAPVGQNQSTLCFDEFAGSGKGAKSDIYELPCCECSEQHVSVDKRDRATRYVS